MSGFVGKSGAYDLTATKALYWHRYRTDSCKTLGDMVQHLEDGGFKVQDKGNYLRVTGPGLGEGYTDFLYMALTGVITAEAFPSRQWK